MTCMRVFTAAAIGITFLFSNIGFAEAADTISRRDGFLVIWSSLRRAETGCSDTPFGDVSEGERGFVQLTFAKCRGLLDDAQDTFRPDTSLSLEDALLWLFRTRNIEVEKGKEIDRLALPSLLQRYLIASLPRQEDAYAKMFVSGDQLMTLMRNLDTLLANEDHEASLYAEDFQGEGTASGEKFDMYALTAAHRSLPFNTLVKVTNIGNGKSVVVRINDRGPYVKGRDLDLSLASFQSIANREEGKIRVTMQRLGDQAIVGPCTRQSVYQTRIAGKERLLPGVPHVLAMGSKLNLHGPGAFVVRSVTYPDGNRATIENWILPGENYQFIPSVRGSYTFRVDTKDGKGREMTMSVAECPLQP